MPSEAEIDFSTGIYRCNDISSFQIKILLKTIKPLSELQDIQDDTLEEFIFSWQQRVFSPWEIKLYSNIDNCLTELHKSYNKQVLEIANDENQNKHIIFSYTSNDVASQPDKQVLHYKQKIFSYLTEAKRLSSDTYLDIHSNIVRTHNIVEYAPSIQTMANNHLISVKQEFMFIMTDVGYLTDGKANEQVLVALKWEPSLRVLTVFPDFNSLSGPGYTIEALSDARCQYLFWFTYPKPENQFVKQVEDKKPVKHENPPIDMVLARHGILDVYLFCEIKSVENFEKRNLFVHYHTDLKKGWKCMSGDLFGVTHRSDNISGTCSFNHLFELHLSFKMSTTDTIHSLRSEVFSQLLLEVVSLDNWGRVCREGCGWIHLQPTAGQHRFNIPTWRPDTNNSRINSMKRFFIGATPHTTHRSFYGVPNSFTGKNLSKFGFETISSGNINVDVNMVLQSQDPNRLPSRTYLLERLSTANLLHSLNSSFKAFSLARQRMLKVSLPVSSD